MAITRGFRTRAWNIRPRATRNCATTPSCPPGDGGVYVTEVAPDGPAAKAGIKAGDVVLELGGQAIDQDGNYEEPLYGRISFVHLVTTRSFAGQKLPVKIMRDGQTQTLEMTLSHQSPQSYVSEPYLIDRRRGISWPTV